MDNLHYCCAPNCPGYPWKASESRHPCGADDEPTRALRRGIDAAVKALVKGADHAILVVKPTA